MERTIRQRNPTELIIAWLDNGVKARGGLRDKEMVREWVTDAVDKRGPDDSDLHRLRADMAKYASQHAPRDIGHLEGLVHWALDQVDWREAGSVIATANGSSPPGAARDRPNWEHSILRHEMDTYRMEGPATGSSPRAAPLHAA